MGYARCFMQLVKGCFHCTSLLHVCWLGPLALAFGFNWDLGWAQMVPPCVLLNTRCSPRSHCCCHISASCALLMTVYASIIGDFRFLTLRFFLKSVDPPHLPFLVVNSSLDGNVVYMDGRSCTCGLWRLVLILNQHMGGVYAMDIRYATACEAFVLWVGLWVNWSGSLAFAQMKSIFWSVRSISLEQ